MSKRIIAMLAAVVAITIVAGCGGGDSSTDSSGSSTSANPGSTSGGETSSGETGGGEGETDGGEVDGGETDGGEGETDGGEASGGDGSSGAAKTQFVKQAEAICKKDHEQVEAELAAFAKENKPKGNAPSKADQEEVIADIVLPSLQTEAEELGELSAPSGDEKKLDEMAGGLEEAVAKAAEDPSTVLKSAGPFTRVNKLMSEYGFKICP